MRRWWALGALFLGGLLLLPAPAADSACCYFSALEKDVNQPGQKAFLTWEPEENIESFTVQPAFEGNAEDFGMVVPTPSQPKLDEMPRDFFKALAVYTILKPMNVQKFKPMLRRARGGGSGGIPAPGSPMPEGDRGVRVLEKGVVGSLDYKIIEATNADGLFQWLDEHGYAYAGDRATLSHYIEKAWFFTVMKIDPKQMRRRPDGSYEGEVTPTRFTFESEKLVYPLRITKLSVKDKTDALFYIQAPEKMDLPGDLSYQLSFQSMWSNAFSFANWEHCTQTEKAWWEVVGQKQGEINQQLSSWRKRNPRGTPSTLEWSRRLTAEDIEIASGARKFDREAPADEIEKLRLLQGILRKGRFVTKCRHIFLTSEMDDDLVFAEASFLGRHDSVEHVEILPTSPP